MNQNQNNEWNKFLDSLPNIPWFAIVIGFAIGAVPGLALLALKMMQESSRKNVSFEQFEKYRQERSAAPIQYTEESRSTRFSSGQAVPNPPEAADIVADGTPRAQSSSGFSAELKKTSSSQRRKSSSGRTKKGIRKFPYRPIKSGKGLMITGGIIAAVFTLAAGTILADWGFDPKYFKLMLEDLIPVLFFWGGGVGTFLWGAFRAKKAKVYKKYLARMDNEPLIPLRDIAQSLPASMDEVCQTVQQMIDDGLFGDRAYIDIGAEMLVIDSSVAKPDPAKRPAREEQREKDVLDFTAEDQILKQIRSANDRIPGEEISRKIDRIEEITRHILTYLNRHPERAGELHTFLDYYLPTTLKMLNTYAELDAQQTDGANIAATKKRIEGILDKVVEGFELQLDKLFEGDMLDIASDIDVMEQMLRRDGLSGDTSLRSRSFEAKAQEGYTPSLTLDPTGTATAPMPDNK